MHADSLRFSWRRKSREERQTASLAGFWNGRNGWTIPHGWVLVAAMMTLFSLKIKALADDTSFSLGMYAGPSLTTVRYDSLVAFWERNEPRFNPHGGIFLEMPLPNHVSLQFGLRYAVISNKVTIRQDPSSRSAPTAPPVNFSIIHQYLSVPISVKIQLPYALNPFLVAGIEWGYLLSARSRITYTDGSTETHDNTDMMNRGNRAIHLGGGIEMPLKGILENFRLFMRFQVAYGIMNIPKRDRWIVGWKSLEIYPLMGISWSPG